MRCHKRIGRRRCLRNSQLGSNYCWQHNISSQAGGGREYLEPFWKKGKTKTWFSGTSMIESLGMLYLLKKHRGDCIVLSKDLINTVYYSSQPLNMPTLNSMPGFRWACAHPTGQITSDGAPDYNFNENFQLQPPPNFVQTWNRCSVNPNKRFLIVPLIIDTYEDVETGYIGCPSIDRLNFLSISPHFTMLIIDFRRQTMEHFDSHGHSSGGEELNRNLVALAGALRLDQFYPASQVCPIGVIRQLDEELINFENAKYKVTQQAPPEQVLGLQSFEELGYTRKGDPHGFCAAWSLFYADFRLTYPDLTPDKATNILLKEFRRKDDNWLIDNLKDFIRGYSEFIRVEGQKIYNNPNQFIKLIREYLD